MSDNQPNQEFAKSFNQSTGLPLEGNDSNQDIFGNPIDHSPKALASYLDQIGLLDSTLGNLGGDSQAIDKPVPSDTFKYGDEFESGIKPIDVFFQTLGKGLETIEHTVAENYPSVRVAIEKIVTELAKETRGIVQQGLEHYSPADNNSNISFSLKLNKSLQQFIKKTKTVLSNELTQEEVNGETVGTASGSSAQVSKVFNQLRRTTENLQDATEQLIDGLFHQTYANTGNSHVTEFGGDLRFGELSVTETADIEVKRAYQSSPLETGLDPSPAQAVAAPGSGASSPDSSNKVMPAEQTQFANEITSDVKELTQQERNLKISLEELDKLISTDASQQQIEKQIDIVLDNYWELNSVEDGLEAQIYILQNEIKPWIEKRQQELERLNQLQSDLEDLLSKSKELDDQLDNATSEYDQILDALEEVNSPEKLLSRLIQEEIDSRKQIIASSSSPEEMAKVQLEIAHLNSLLKLSPKGIEALRAELDDINEKILAKSVKSSTSDDISIYPSDSLKIYGGHNDKNQDIDKVKLEAELFPGIFRQEKSSASQTAQLRREAMLLKAIIAAYETVNLQVEKDSLSIQKVKKVKFLEELQHKITQNEEQISNLKNKIKEVNSEIQKSTEIINEKEAEIEQAESEQASAQEELQNFLNHYEYLLPSMERESAFEERETYLNDQLDKASDPNQKAVLEQALSWVNLQELLTEQDWDSLISDLEQRQTELEQSNSSAASALQHYIQFLKQTEPNEIYLPSDLENLKSTLEELEQEHSHLQEILTSSRSNPDSLQSAYSIQDIELLERVNDAISFEVTQLQAWQGFLESINTPQKNYDEQQILWQESFERLLNTTQDLSNGERRFERLENTWQQIQIFQSSSEKYFDGWLQSRLERVADLHFLIDFGLAVSEFEPGLFESAIKPQIESFIDDLEGEIQLIEEISESIKLHLHYLNNSSVFSEQLSNAKSLLEENLEQILSLKAQYEAIATDFQNTLAESEDSLTFLYQVQKFETKEALEHIQARLEIAKEFEKLNIAIQSGTASFKDIQAFSQKLIQLETDDFRKGRQIGRNLLQSREAQAHWFGEYVSLLSTELFPDYKDYQLADASLQDSLLILENLRSVRDIFEEVFINYKHDIEDLTFNIESNNQFQKDLENLKNRYLNPLSSINKEVNTQSTEIQVKKEFAERLLYKHKYGFKNKDGEYVPGLVLLDESIEDTLNAAQNFERKADKKKEAFLNLLENEGILIGFPDDYDFDLERWEEWLRLDTDGKGRISIHHDSWKLSLTVDDIIRFGKPEGIEWLGFYDKAKKKYADAAELKKDAEPKRLQVDFWHAQVTQWTFVDNIAEDIRSKTSEIKKFFTVDAALQKEEVKKAKEILSMMEKHLPVIDQQLKQAEQDLGLAESNLASDLEKYGDSADSYRQSISEIFEELGQSGGIALAYQAELDKAEDWALQQEEALADRRSWIDLLRKDLTERIALIDKQIQTAESGKKEQLRLEQSDLQQSYYLLGKLLDVLDTQTTSVDNLQELEEAYRDEHSSMQSLAEDYTKNPDLEGEVFNQKLLDTRAVLSEGQRLASAAEVGSEALVSPIQELRDRNLAQTSEYLSATEKLMPIIDGLDIAISTAQASADKALVAQKDLNKLNEDVIQALEDAEQNGDREAAHYRAIAEAKGAKAAADAYVLDTEDLITKTQKSYRPLLALYAEIASHKLEEKYSIEERVRIVHEIGSLPHYAAGNGTKEAKKSAIKALNEIASRGEFEAYLVELLRLESNIRSKIKKAYGKDIEAQALSEVMHFGRYHVSPESRNDTWLVGHTSLLRAAEKSRTFVNQELDDASEKRKQKYGSLLIHYHHESQRYEELAHQATTTAHESRISRVAAETLLFGLEHLDKKENSDIADEVKRRLIEIKDNNFVELFQQFDNLSELVNSLSSALGSTSDIGGISRFEQISQDLNDARRERDIIGTVIQEAEKDLSNNFVGLFDQLDAQSALVNSLSETLNSDLSDLEQVQQELDVALRKRDITSAAIQQTEQALSVFVEAGGAYIQQAQIEQKLAISRKADLQESAFKAFSQDILERVYKQSSILSNIEGLEQDDADLHFQAAINEFQGIVSDLNGKSGDPILSDVSDDPSRKHHLRQLKEQLNSIQQQPFELSESQMTLIHEVQLELDLALQGKEALNIQDKLIPIIEEFSLKATDIRNKITELDEKIEADLTRLGVIGDGGDLQKLQTVLNELADEADTSNILSQKIYDLTAKYSAQLLDIDLAESNIDDAEALSSEIHRAMSGAISARIQMRQTEEQRLIMSILTPITVLVSTAATVVTLGAASPLLGLSLAAVAAGLAVAQGAIQGDVAGAVTGGILALASAVTGALGQAGMIAKETVNLSNQVMQVVKAGIDSGRAFAAGDNVAGGLEILGGLMIAVGNDLDAFVKASKDHLTESLRETFEGLVKSLRDAPQYLYQGIKGIESGNWLLAVDGLFNAATSISGNILGEIDQDEFEKLDDPEERKKYLKEDSIHIAGIALDKSDKLGNTVLLVTQAFKLGTLIDGNAILNIWKSEIHNSKKLSESTKASQGFSSRQNTVASEDNESIRDNGNHSNQEQDTGGRGFWLNEDDPTADWDDDPIGGLDPETGEPEPLFISSNPSSQEANEDDPTADWDDDPIGGIDYETGEPEPLFISSNPSSQENNSPPGQSAEVGTDELLYGGLSRQPASQITPAPEEESISQSIPPGSDAYTVDFGEEAYSTIRNNVPHQSENSQDGVYTSEHQSFSSPEEENLSMSFIPVSEPRSTSITPAPEEESISQSIPPGSDAYTVDFGEEAYSTIRSNVPHQSENSQDGVYTSEHQSFSSPEEENLNMSFIPGSEARSLPPGEEAYSENESKLSSKEPSYIEAFIEGISDPEFELKLKDPGDWEVGYLGGNQVGFDIELSLNSKSKNLLQAAQSDHFFYIEWGAGFNFVDRVSSPKYKDIDRNVEAVGNVDASAGSAFEFGKSNPTEDDDWLIRVGLGVGFPGFDLRLYAVDSDNDGTTEFGGRLGLGQYLSLEIRTEGPIIMLPTILPIRPNNMRNGKKFWDIYEIMPESHHKFDHFIEHFQDSKDNNDD